MDKKQFKILIAVIVTCYILQTLFIFWRFYDAEVYNQHAYNKLLHLSDYIENIDNNVATIDDRLVDMTYKVNTLYDKSYGLN